MRYLVPARVAAGCSNSVQGDGSFAEVQMCNWRVRALGGGGEMREIDVSKVGIYFVFFWLGLILIIIAGLFIEAFLQTEKAAEWASAIGGFLAVAAAAIIAVAQSRQNKKNIDAQIAAQERSSAHQAALQASALSHQSALNEANLSAQIRLQRAAFAFQKSIRKDDLAQSRQSATSTIAAAYEIMANIVKAIRTDDGPSTHFISVYSQDAELSLHLCRTVQYGHLTEPDDIRVLGRILIDLSDTWSALKSSSNALTDEYRYYYRAAARVKMRRVSQHVKLLNPNWVESHQERLSFDDNEAREIQNHPKEWPPEAEVSSS